MASKPSALVLNVSAIGVIAGHGRGRSVMLTAGVGQRGRRPRRPDGARPSRPVQLAWAVGMQRQGRHASRILDVDPAPRVKAAFGTHPHGFLMTQGDAGWPHARLVQRFTIDDDLSVWIGTSRRSRKVAEIRRWGHATYPYGLVSQRFTLTPPAGWRPSPMLSA